jgi:hypothetical protein
MSNNPKMVSTIGSIFLLNNTSYVRSRLTPALTSILSSSTLSSIDSSFRLAKAGYFDTNFSPLLQILGDDPRNKSSTKEKFTRFYDLLEEVTERHQMVRVLQDDEDGREVICDEVVRLVVPSLQRFTQKHKEKEFSKSKFFLFSAAFGAYFDLYHFHLKIRRSVSLYPFLFVPKLLSVVCCFLDIKMSAEAVEAQIRNFYQ